MVRLWLALALLFGAIDRGPWLLIGRTPDRNPYTCTASTSGTYVGPSSSITDSGCAVWTLGSGTTPNIVVLRNGSQPGGALGARIEYYLGVVYVQGTDLNWYAWDGTLGYFQFYSSTDPSMAVTPVGYFVAKTGSDSNTCLQAQSESAPKLTIVAGIACVTAGSTVYVRTGTYDEIVNGTPSGTSWANKVRITNYPGETVWLHPLGNPAAYALYFFHLEQYVEWDGINVDGSNVQFGPVKIEGYDVSIGNPHHIRMQNLEIIADPNSTPGAGHNGILVSAQVAGLQDGYNEFINLTIHRLRGYGFYISASRNLIDHCTVYDGNGAGIHISNSYNTAGHFNTVSNNTVHDILGGQPGFNPSIWGIVNGSGAPSNNTYFNNVVYNIAGSTSGDAGIYLLTGDSINLYNNTVYGGTAYGIRVSQASVTNTTLRNNIAYANTLGDYSNSGTGTTETSNSFAGVNPVFVNPATFDFHLQFSSPAKDTGTSLASIFTTDKDGTPRPQGPAWDKGAYERIP